MQSRFLCRRHNDDKKKNNETTFIFTRQRLRVVNFGGNYTVDPSSSFQSIGPEHRDKVASVPVFVIIFSPLLKFIIKINDSVPTTPVRSVAVVCKRCVLYVYI